MSNLSFLGLVLIILIVVSTINSYRMWHGRQGWIPRPSSPEYRKTYKYQRYMTANAISPLVWWSFGLITLGRYGLRKSSSGLFHALPYVAVFGGWALLIATLVSGIFVFSIGRPKWLVPSQFREAGEHRWVENRLLP
jgi:hypothetical protein